eukprot:6201006-Prymnesium_polylepis.1
MARAAKTPLPLSGSGHCRISTPRAAGPQGPSSRMTSASVDGGATSVDGQRSEMPPMNASTSSTGAEVCDGGPPLRMSDSSTFLRAAWSYEMTARLSSSERPPLAMIISRSSSVLAACSQ